MPLPEHLPRKEHIIEPEGDLTGFKKIGEEVTEELEYEPCKLFVNRYVRPKYVKGKQDGVLIGDLPRTANVDEEALTIKKNLQRSETVTLVKSESHASYQADKLEVRDLSTTKSRCVITKEKYNSNRSLGNEHT